MLRDKLNDAMKEAMRARDQAALGTIRLILAKQLRLPAILPKNGRRFGMIRLFKLLQRGGTSCVN